MGAHEGTQVSRHFPLIISAVSTVAVLVIGTALFLNYILMPKFVHLGRETEVPDVRGMPEPEADAVLGMTGLSIAETRAAPHPTMPEGYVLKTTPPHWMKVKEGRKVVLTVSSGPRWAEVPNLFRMTQKLSEITLREHGLELGEVHQEYCDTVPQGLVIRSDPEHGSKLQWGDSVSIVVSLGKRLVRVPDLRGMTVGEARKLLKELGLILDTGIITDMDLRIEAQSPAPGREVLSGSEISVQVSMP